jgi:hypothetical protein
MSLLDIRRQFVESSGRVDLVVDTVNYADRGANWFIQAGQRYLDRKLETGNARARYFGKLAYGTNTMKMPKARVIEKVIRAYPETKTELYKDNCPSLFVNDQLGVPKSYIPLTIRPAVGTVLDLIPGNEATISWSDITFHGLLFNINAEIDYGIEVDGLFYSPDLLMDTDRSFWTEEHPEILVASSFLAMERFYRNFDGLKESKASVDELIMQLDFDYVAQEIVNIVRLEG